MAKASPPLMQGCSETEACTRDPSAFVDTPACLTQDCGEMFVIRLD